MVEKTPEAASARAKLVCLQADLIRLKELLTRTYAFQHKCRVLVKNYVHLPEEDVWNYFHNKRALKGMEERTRRLRMEIKDANTLHNLHRLK